MPKANELISRNVLVREALFSARTGELEAAVQVCLLERYGYGHSGKSLTQVSQNRSGKPAPLPLPVLRGERVGVRGGHLLEGCPMISSAHLGPFLFCSLPHFRDGPVSTVAGSPTTSLKFARLLVG